jgi:hypothetical protein
VQPNPRECEGRHTAECAREARERAELHRPLRRREREQQQPHRRRADQPPCRALGHAGHSAPPQQHSEHAEQAQHQHQHGEATGQGGVGAVLDGQEVVAQELLIPRDRRADLVLDARGFGDGGQRLVAEHHNEDQCQRGS